MLLSFCTKCKTFKQYNFDLAFILILILEDWMYSLEIQTKTELKNAELDFIKFDLNM